MAADRRLARVHLDRLGHGTRFVGELLEGELQLPRVDAFGFLPEQPLAEDVQLMAERRVLALGRGELVVQRGNQRARGGEIGDVRHRARVRHERMIRDGGSPAYKRDHATRSYHRRRRVCATSTPESRSARSVLRISTGPGGSSVGHANVPCSSRL